MRQLHVYVAFISALALFAPQNARALDPGEHVAGALASLDAGGRTPVVVFEPGTSRPTYVHGFRTIPLAADPLQAARHFLESNPALLAVLDPVTELVPAGVVPWKGRSVVRFEQVYGGLPVFHRAAVVRVEPDGSVSALATNLGEVDPLLGTVPALTAAVATDAALARVPWRATARSTTLGVWIQHDGAHLAWRVSLDGPAQSKAAVILVDAASGKMLAGWDPIRTARGLVFLQNPVRDGDTPTEVELLRLTGDGTTLTGEYAHAWLYDPGEAHTQTAVADTSGDFLYDPAARTDEPVFDDPFAEVNGYYQIDWISNYYRTVHGYTPPTSPMRVYVNYVDTPDEPFENAFFDPESWTIALGQGPTGDFAYDADTIYHEFTHSVTQSTARFVYWGADQLGSLVFPGGLDEGLADTFAASITDDPDMSEYMVGRNLVNDRACPEDIVGEVHYDGEIIGGANWEIHEIAGGPALQLMAYGSLITLTSTASFADYAAGVMAAAGALESDGDLTATQVEQIQTVLDERGVSTCARVMSLDDGVSYSYTILGMDAMGRCDTMFPMFEEQDFFFPPDFQWSIDVPEDAASLTIDASTVITGARGDEIVAINVRAGEPIIHEMVEIFSGFSMPLRVRDADAIYENPAGPIVLDGTTDPALVTGETYYFTVGYRGCPKVQVSVSAAPELEAPEPEPSEPEPEEQPEPVEDAFEDAEADVPEPIGEVRSRGGCGCSMVR